MNSSRRQLVIGLDSRCQHENEKDGSTRHAEFTVRHAATGQLLSIEAKSRHRAGVLAMPGTPESYTTFAAYAINKRRGG
jgi:hypothetical protein